MAKIPKITATRWRALLKILMPISLVPCCQPSCALHPDRSRYIHSHEWSNTDIRPTSRARQLPAPICVSVRYRGYPRRGAQEARIRRALENPSASRLSSDHLCRQGLLYPFHRLRAGRLQSGLSPSDPSRTSSCLGHAPPVEWMDRGVSAESATTCGHPCHEHEQQPAEPGRLSKIAATGEPGARGNSGSHFSHPGRFGGTGDAQDLRILLRAELRTLIIRLGLHCQPDRDPSTHSSASARRFDKFRIAVNRNFARMHTVAAYAAMLGLTEKSLQRAAMAIRNMPAKTVIVQRIALEAKRLLVHGDLSVSQISEELGFSEPTNFVKFFSREAGMTPGRFRGRHRHHPRIE